VSRDRSLRGKKKVFRLFFLDFLLSAAEIAERGKRKNVLKIFSKKIIKKNSGEPFGSFKVMMKRFLTPHRNQN
jgi:hypothetical protein